MEVRKAARHVQQHAQAHGARRGAPCVREPPRQRAAVCELHHERQLLHLAAVVQELRRAVHKHEVVVAEAILQLRLAPKSRHVRRPRRVVRVPRRGAGHALDGNGRAQVDRFIHGSKRAAAQLHLVAAAVALKRKTVGVYAENDRHAQAAK